MCRSSSEAGGPKRCSGDTRTGYSQAAQAVDRLERRIQDLSRTPRRIDTSLHAALRNAVLTKTDTDPDELDREVAEAIGSSSDAVAASPSPQRTRHATGPAQPRPACFFCDTIIAPDDAAHLTRHGKVCCRQCWPDIRLVAGPGGGL